MIKNITIAFFLLLTIVEAKDYGSVNGELITPTDISMVMAQSGMTYDTLDASMKKRVLEMVVERKLLTQTAEKSGIEKSKDYISQLKSLKRELALDVWMKKEMKVLEDALSAKKLQNYYNKNKEKYSSPLQLKARHVLVATEDEANAIIKEIDAAKDKSKIIDDLGKKHEKTTGPLNLGWFELQRMVPEFSAAAEKLKVGTYSKTPVKTEFGYHVIYLDNRKEASVKPFKVVEEEIKNELTAKEFASKMKAKTDALKKSAKIELK